MASRVGRALLALVVGLAILASAQAARSALHETWKGSQLGVVVDGVYGITPTKYQLSELGAVWERSVVGARGTSHSKRRDDWCLDDQPSLGSILDPSTNWVMTFDNQSCNYDAPLGSHSPRVWRSYIDRHFVPSLLDFMKDNVDFLVATNRLRVFEIWNEENCVGIGSYIPPLIYAEMLGRSAAAIARWNVAHHAHVRTLMGGLCNPREEVDGQSTYLETVLQTRRPGLRQVGPIGIHMAYGLREPKVWSAEIEFFRGLAQRYARADGPHQIWDTESGASDGLVARHSQARFAYVLFSTLERARVPVIIWYAFNDQILGSTGHGGWGLFDTCGLLKPSGAVFARFARHLSRRPPAGSGTEEHLVGLRATDGSLFLRFLVDVGCPSGSETPSRPVTLTDTVTNARSGNAPLVKTLAASYQEGGIDFTVPMIGGMNSVVAAYAGDHELEGGASRAATVRIGFWATHADALDCSGAILSASSVVRRQYQADPSSLGPPLAGGAILDLGGRQIAFFQRDAIIVHGSIAQTVKAASVLKALGLAPETKSCRSWPPYLV